MKESMENWPTAGPENTLEKSECEPPVLVQPVVRARPTFDEWLNECSSDAMSSEWCIDPAWRWRELYEQGQTPRQAVDALFDDISASNVVCVSSTSRSVSLVVRALRVFDAHTESAQADSMQRVVGLRTFNAVMDYAAKNNWSEQLLVDVCKQKFGRVRQGVGVLRERYRELLQAQSNAELCGPAEKPKGT